jgi:hypothetical protein
MSDGGPGAALRALVAAAVGDDRADPANAVTVVERGDDPGPAARIAALVDRAAEGDGAEDAEDDGAENAEGDGAEDDEDAEGGGEAIVGVTPRADPSLARRVARGLDAETRLVFTGSAGERLAGPAAPAVRSALGAHGVEPYRHEGDSPVAVLLVGDRAVVGLFDERGLAAVGWSDAAPVREWAADTCRRFLADSDAV